MVQIETNHLKLIFMAQNQVRKELVFNENILKIDALLNSCLTNNIQGELSPPIIPENGIYYVGANAINQWINKDNHLAFWHDNNWYFILPNEGLILWSKIEKKICVYYKNKWNPQ